MIGGFDTSPEDDLQLLRTAAVSGGIIAAGFFRREVKTWTKENSSPVTEADFMVDTHLARMLLDARPHYGWLSEETVDSKDRLRAARLFVVDPIDGTRGFLRGEDSWSISLAVVENGRPVAGVIYAPARDELYEASLGGGARRNGVPLIRQAEPGREPLIPLPGAVHQELQTAGLEYTRGPHYTSLAYRLTQVATGGLDAAVARRGSHDWDIAGAAIILSEAGITFEDVCAGQVVFNRPELRHSALLAVADETLYGPLHAALKQVYGCPAELDLPEHPQSLEERLP
jgi:myo-inositol-1(or 4)-monophosphatase